ncbi:MAG: HPr family phosphocarrier protein [Ruminococcus sp.]|jgi:phosphotransferase system HPr-like phosphotransfer protein|nr:HPr family phosphocarrier protein [Ruminococcus sp.]
MTAFKITFQTPEEILDFVSKVEKYDYAMDMKRDRFIVDAKSILGIMNLGLNSVIDLEIYGDDCKQLEQDISRYIAA